MLLANGEWAKWNAIRTSNFKDKSKAKSFEIDTSAISNTHFPNMAYGFEELPEQKSYFIENATLWTNEAGGIIKDANLLIVDGKIKSVNSKRVSIPNGAVIIDAEGKHVTTGIYDLLSYCIAVVMFMFFNGWLLSFSASIFCFNH